MWQLNTESSYVSLRKEFTEELITNMLTVCIIIKVRRHERRHIVILTSV